MRIDDRFYMKLALNEAWKYQGLSYPNPAVGCVILEKGRLVAAEAHRKAGESHAEVRALLSAYETMEGRSAPVDPSDAHAAHEFLLSLPGNFFGETTLYVTLEPCSHTGKTPSCAWLLSRLAPKRVVIALPDPVEEHAGGIEILADHGIDVETGVCRQEAEKLLEPFMIWRERAFTLFKLAQTSNGRIGGGYLSGEESLKHVHRMRSVADELVIGGGTVRADRPRLDCRLVGACPPDVTIYSRRNEYDRSIPLFGIGGRKVSIRDSLETLLRRPGFLLIEGGEGMLRALRGKIDWMLLYQTPKLSSHPLSYNIDQKLEFLHQCRIGADLMIWSRCG